MIISNYETKPWRDFLPHAYAWAADVRLASTKSFDPNAWNVIATVKAGDEGFALDAPGLDGALATEILSSARTLGWKGQGGHVKLVVGNHPVVLLASSTVATTGVQKSRQFGLDLAQALKDVVVKPLVIADAAGLDRYAVFEGLTQGYYDGGVFKEKPQRAELPKAVSFCGGASLDESRASEARAMARALYVTRLVQDAPANWLDSERFAEIALNLVKDSPRAKAKTLGREDMRRLGMGSFLGVAAGSPTDPKLIVIEIKGRDSSKQVALVGKGLTFDSGGVNIKPSAGLAEMKYDMSGGAAVLGAASYLADVEPPVDVVCLIGAVENAVSGTAIRPGDVLQAMNGKTIEVLNTDAEGRLVLADVLCYATSQYKPDLILDAATLTGAVLHGLGHAGAALVTHQDDTADFVAAAAKKAGEPVWRLPLWPELSKELKSEIADVANIPKPSVLAGSIIGGMFLKEFVPEQGTRWAHLDIAGTAWSCSATGFPGAGGSAFGVRTMVQVCFDYHQ